MVEWIENSIFKSFHYSQSWNENQNKPIEWTIYESVDSWRNNKSTFQQDIFSSSTKMSQNDQNLAKESEELFSTQDLLNVTEGNTETAETPEITEPMTEEDQPEIPETEETPADEEEVDNEVDEEDKENADDPTSENVTEKSAAKPVKKLAADRLTELPLAKIKNIIKLDPEVQLVSSKLTDILLIYFLIKSSLTFQTKPFSSSLEPLRTSSNRYPKSQRHSHCSKRRKLSSNRTSISHSLCCLLNSENFIDKSKIFHTQSLQYASKYIFFIQLQKVHKKINFLPIIESIHSDSSYLSI